MPQSSCLSARQTIQRTIAPLPENVAIAPSAPLGLPVRAGAFAVAYDNGKTARYGSGEPQFVLLFHEGKLLDLLGDDPFLRFGEAYMDGAIDVEGDLADVVSFGLRNGLARGGDRARRLAISACRLAATGVRSFRRQKRDIAHHYDLGNDFFRLWLDDSLTYSCAYFRTPKDTLDRAQAQKLDHSPRKLRLQPEETLLDIGCGWGALILRAAGHFGARALGITLSEEQCAGARAAIEARGLRGMAEVRLLGYDGLAREGRQFDKIVSIGMIEHVGKAQLDEFARAVESLLKPGGLALLHMITGVSEEPASQWIYKYIFPGGYIPTLPKILRHASDRNFLVWDVENLGLHYARTLDLWSSRFEQVAERVREKFGEAFVRMWRLYLRSSFASFREGLLQVHQILLSRGPAKDLPLTRDDLSAASTPPVDTSG